MALDFLSLIPAVAGLYTQYKASKPTAAENQAAQSLADQRYYQQQLADPNSPLMKAYTAADQATLDRQFAGSINDLINQNRRQTLMGRRPLFDAERGDQQIWRAQQLGFQNNMDQARVNARQTIAGLASGAGGQATGYNQLAGTQRQRQQGNADFINNIAQTGTDILSKILASNNPNNPASLVSPRMRAPTVQPTGDINTFNTGYNYA